MNEALTYVCRVPLLFADWFVQHYMQGMNFYQQQSPAPPQQPVVSGGSLPAQTFASDSTPHKKHGMQLPLPRNITILQRMVVEQDELFSDLVAFSSFTLHWTANISLEINFFFVVNDTLKLA
jgi:hypothetical protein